MTKAIICGGRDFRDIILFQETMALVHKTFNLSRVIEGVQRTFVAGNIVGGADWFANVWARERFIPVTCVQADWRTHKKAAGMIRNSEMADMLDPACDIVVAFNTGGPGTADMIKKAMSRGIKVIEIACANV